MTKSQHGGGWEGGGSQKDTLVSGIRKIKELGLGEEMIFVSLL
jgi:hypothetical protein